jgi:hypothetical protein
MSNVHCMLYTFWSYWSTTGEWPTMMGTVDRDFGVLMQFNCKERRRKGGLGGYCAGSLTQREE